MPENIYLNLLFNFQLQPNLSGAHFLQGKSDGKNSGNGGRKSLP